MNSPENPIAGKRELRVGDEPVLCFERDFAVNLPTDVGKSNSNKTIHLPSIECKSAGPLDVMFSGGMRVATRRDYAEFYSILGSIQKNLR
jgi:hypothetical protein